MTTPGPSEAVTLAGMPSDPFACPSCGVPATECLDGLPCERCQPLDSKVHRGP